MRLLLLSIISQISSLAAGVRVVREHASIFRRFDIQFTSIHIACLLILVCACHNSDSSLC